MNEAFRQAGTLNEFYEELDAIVANCKSTLVWQTDREGKRVKLKTRIISYKLEIDQTLIMLPLGEVESFKKKLDYFIYDEKDGILFKGRFLRNDQERVILRADENVFLREKRVFHRVYFQYTKVYVDVSYGQKLEFHSLLLKDISEDGYGLLITGAMSKALLAGMTLGITKIHSIKLPRPLEGKIIHSTILEEDEDPKRTKVKLGVKFHKKSKLIELVKKAMKSEI